MIFKSERSAVQCSVAVMCFDDELIDILISVRRVAQWYGDASHLNVRRPPSSSGHSGCSPRCSSTTHEPFIQAQHHCIPPSLHQQLILGWNQQISFDVGIIFFIVKLCTLKVQFLIKFPFLIFLIYKPNFSLLLAWDRRAKIRILADRSFNVFCKIYTADSQPGSTNKSELKNLIFHKTWILSHNFSNFAEKKIR